MRSPTATPTSRRLLPPAIAIALLPATLPAGAPATATPPADDAYELVRELMEPDPRQRRPAARKLLRGNDPRIVPGLVDALFFTSREHRAELVEVLRALSGHTRGADRYQEWVEVVGARSDIEPLDGYQRFKALLFSRIDPRYVEILGQQPALVRFEEIVWGGVRVEGLPALERPARVTAQVSTGLGDRDLVLGVALGGAHHAYPVKVVSWHEMVNDEVGGEPITLSYCTLCGSAVLYSARRPSGETLTFGTSGLLYRSNKLMIDRATGSLWSNLTGEAVLGPASAERARLLPLPVTLTRWGAWLREHPDTTVMEVDARAGRRFGFLYEEGAADRARAGVSFPVWQRDERLPAKTEVLAIRVADRPKAYELEALRARGILDDTVGGMAIVLVADADGAVRAYRRGDNGFRGGSEPGLLLDQAGERWRVAEDALQPLDREAAPLERLPSHVAFWFGWYGFYPDTELWTGGE